jgi:PKD repeat protein
MHTGLRILLLFTILAAVIAVPVASESVQVKFQGILLDRESRPGGGTISVEITDILEDPGHVLNIGESVNITYMTGLPPGAQQDFEIDPNATVGRFVEVFCTETNGTLTLRDGNYVRALTTYTITATGSDGGTIEPSGLVEVAAGANQTFTMTPDPKQLDCWGNGKLFVVWNVTVDGQVVGADPIASSKPVLYNFTDVQENHTIHAEFTYALINARPIAKFRADPTSGPAPLTVNFSQTLVSNNTGILWSFGDNTTSTEQNPVHSYTSPGVYDVTFTIFCDNLSFSDPPLPITVLPPPVPNGTLYIASFPTGATILINGTDYGRTDTFITVPSGIRNLTLTKPGYQPYTTNIKVPAGDLKVLPPITLTKGGPVPPGGTGTLYVASYPKGATILIDGTDRGRTDGFVRNVTAGVHHLTLTKNGYAEYSASITVPSQGVKVLAPITLTKGGSGVGGIEDIQAAIDAASEGDILVLNAGTYSANIVINKSLTILGAGPGLTILNGNTGTAPDKGGVINITRPFPHAPFSPNVTLIGMTITEGDANYGGGVFNDGGNLNLSQVSITNSSASLSGGGIYNEMGTVILNGSSFSDNTAKVGGGVMNDAGTFVMNAGSGVEDNVAQIGGGINNVNGVMIMADGSFVTGNTATYDGGGMALSFYSTVTMNGGSVSGNTAETGVGGGIYIDDTSIFHQYGGSISGNSPDEIFQET